MFHPGFCLLQSGPLTAYLQPLNELPDLEQISRCLAGRTPLVWLDSARPHAITGRWSLLACDPWLTLVARGERIELRTSASTRRFSEHPLAALRQVLRRYGPGRRTESLGPFGRAIGLVGYLSYDLNRWIERLPAPQPTEPSLPQMLWFGMRTVILIDHRESRGWLLAIADPHMPPRLARRQARESLERSAELLRTPEPAPAEPFRSTALTAISSQAEFEAMVRRALEHIQAGDIFQANLSHRFTATCRGSALSLYGALRRINPSPFACFLSWDGLAVVSCSPERLARVQEGRVDTRPIAGTRARGATPAEDAAQSLQLLLSDKERAEHIMLVDLARNDLGRVAVCGSVCVNELLALEAYSHVIHIVSDVSATLRPGLDAVDVIRAVFPGGTITGCPKVRCMQILRQIEPVARGLYTGSLGYVGFDGTMDLNIAIRTILLQRDRLSFHVGAGIVADSDPAREYQETLAKGAALMRALHTVAESEMTVHETAS